MKKIVSISVLLVLGLCAWAQEKEVVAPAPVRMRLSVFERIINDASDGWRTDQNLVGNFRMGKWMRLEAGLRWGERPQSFDAYYHYKLELQSKWFYDRVRVFLRLTDNVSKVPLPTYRKTMGVVAAETKWPFAEAFQVIAGGGYTFSWQQHNEIYFLPTLRGSQSDYPVYKLALKYEFENKSELEAMYGSYDVFNPDIYTKPFFQVMGMFPLSGHCKLRSYVRYQYDERIRVADKYFFSIGIEYAIR